MSRSTWALSAFLAAASLAGPAHARRPAMSNDIDPNLYVNALDTTVAYDDLLNARDYDDGYAASAYKPFEAELAPHGTWADTARLGRVWFPAAKEVGDDFVPYATHGRWALTQFGWTWRSDWSWGWAPFHYGRWAVLPGRGWCWIPGTIWSPAWVAWRSGRNYIAWAPLPPEGMSLGRPLGPRSPWTMNDAPTFGTRAASNLPRRVVPSLFGRTTALSNPRPVTEGALTVEVNAGPTRHRCCRDRPVEHLADVGPRPEIHPASGAALDTRPWVQRRFAEQTPLCAWPADGTRDSGPCVLTASAPPP